MISEIKSTATLSPTAYDISFGYKVKGLASIFSSFKSNLAVSGKIMSDQTLRPERFYNRGSWSKNFFEAKTRFSPDDSKIIDHQFDFKFDKEAKYIPVKEDRRFGPDLVSYYLGLMLMDPNNIEKEKPKH